MDLLDELLDVHTSTADEPLGGSDDLLYQATTRLLAGLAGAQDPVAWLRQLAVALDSQAVADANWHMALPVALAQDAPGISAAAAQWRVALEQAQQQQAKDFADLLPVGSLPQSYPQGLCDDYLQQHLERLLTRFGESTPSEQALQPWCLARTLRQSAAQQVAKILAGPVQRWDEQLESMRGQITAAMAAEASLQVEEGQLNEAVRARLFTPKDDEPVQWLAVHIGKHVVPGVWAVVQAGAWAAGSRGSPMVLWVHGEGGGMVYADDLERLRERLHFTLTAADMAASAGLPDDAAELVLSPSADGFTGVVRTLLQYWEARLQAKVDASAAGLQLASDEDIERRLDLAHAALAIPEDSCRQCAFAAAQRLWQADAMVDFLPQWLLAHSEEERKTYAATLRDYQRSAATLESWLLGQVPELSIFAGQMLCEAFRKDLKIDVQPDTPLLRRPVSVTFQWLGEGTVIEPSPEYAPLEPMDPPGQGIVWIPSDEWESMTPAQLAMEGFNAGDQAEHERLHMAQWHIAGISAAYLSRTLVALDPLKQFEAQLLQTFYPQQDQDKQRLERPYRLEMQLLAKAKRWNRDLSEEGASMLNAAASAQTSAALATAGMRIHWLAITSTEELGPNIRGAGALVNQHTGRTLLYLPGAPDGDELIERGDLEGALEYLRDAIGSRPQFAAYVAHRSADDASKLLSYFNQAALRGYGGYLSAPVTLDQTLVGLQLADRHQLLLGEARQQGRSQLSIQMQNNLQSHERRLGYLRAGLAMLPGISAVIGFQDIRDGAVGVASAWRARDADALGWAALSVVGGVVDVLQTVVPAVGGLSALRRALRLRVRQFNASRPLAGYVARRELSGGMPLQGRDTGTWQLNGDQYIWQDGRAYKVYRRTEETTLRLRATATRRYEAPVRQDGGRWVLHAEVGLRGGKLNDAELVFANYGPSSLHPTFAGKSRTTATRRGKEVLENYRFPDDARAEDFAYAYLQQRQAPAWAQQYLRGAGGAQLPQPPIQEPWQQVRWRIGSGDYVSARSDGAEVMVRFAGTEDYAYGVRIQGEYYPQISAGAANAQELYIRPVGPLPQSLGELDDLIRQGRGPVRVRRGTGPGLPPEVLGQFPETFNARLARRFSGLSAESREALGEVLYHHASGSLLNPGRRTNTTLNSILLSSLEQQVSAPDLDPLALLTLQGVPTRQMQLQLIPSRAGRLDQLRWRLDGGQNTALRRAMALENGNAFDEAVERVIAAQGYQVRFRNSHAGLHLVFFEREAGQNLYLLVQHERMGAISLNMGNSVMLFSDTYLDILISRLPNMAWAGAVRTARQQGRLRPMLGGLNIDGPNTTELVLQRVQVALPGADQALVSHNWRRAGRPLTAADRELLPGSGMYGGEGDALVHGVQVDNRWLAVFVAEDTSQILLSRSQSLAPPLSFDELERCVRERFGDQPWVVARVEEGWSVRRPLFRTHLDRQVSRARPGLTDGSARNAARTLFEEGQGSEAARLLHLENVLTRWQGDSTVLGELADPMLLLAPQRPLGLEGAVAWRMDLPAQAVGARPAVHYLRAVDAPTQQLLASVTGSRLRRHTINVVDDMLERYGWVCQHRAGDVAQFHQLSTGRLYLVLRRSSEQVVVEVAFEEGQALMSQAWIARWRQQLGPQPGQALDQALAEGRLVRLMATLRLEPGPHNGQVAVQRLSDF